MRALERFEDFAFPPSQQRETFQFRSTWLASSLRSLRDRSLLEAYRAHLPARFHAPVLESVAGVWLPVEIAVAHYASLDALDIPPSTVFEMGREIQTHAQSIVAKLVLRTSRSVGVTPWAIFGEMRKLWDRTWRGGDFMIGKAGPKEAEIHIVGWSVAPSPYIRHAMRGVLDGLTGMFCTKPYVRDVPEKCTGLQLGYRIAWV
jgi:hypothetical protein